MFGIAPFRIACGGAPTQATEHDSPFTLGAPTTWLNCRRVLRAMQLSRPILLEGSPGIGKTGLIVALARASGHRVVRINLSEQTDIMDLLGAELPVEGGAAGRFEWRDGALLQALKAGDWVLLDEMNLASQSVLEGLNACLDHRATVFVPELGRSFACPPTFRVFACQNPTAQGGGRKGLPKSFVNRFAQVHVAPLGAADLRLILTHSFPAFASPTLRCMVRFSAAVVARLENDPLFLRRGRPWQFNLRDITRWCELLTLKRLPFGGDGVAPWHAADFLDCVYLQRLRGDADRQQVMAMFAAAFDVPLADVEARVRRRIGVHVSGGAVQVGVATLPFASERMFHAAVADDVRLLPELNRPLEALALCMEQRWLAVLVGDSASGKTSLVRALATLCGARLVEFSAVDTAELLGGFEQVDATRHRRRALTAVAALVESARLSWLEQSGVDVDALADAQRAWHAVERQGGASPLAAAHYDELDALVARLATLLGVSGDDARAKLAMARELDGGSKAVGRFEWIDGVLIDALETGAWLLIDNVNFCSPTVLDRLNPLLEPNGVLLVNERGLVGGQIKAIRAHPNFRIVMCMDAHNGEISRAMRNRGVEICLASAPPPPPPSKAAPTPTGTAVQQLAPPTCAERVTAGRLLVAAGVHDARAVDVAWRVHAAMQQLVGLRVRWRDLRHLGELVVVLAQCGVPASADAWQRAAHMAYGGRATSAATRERFAQCLDAVRAYVGAAVASGDVGVDVRWLVPTVRDLRRDHTLATAQTQLAAAVTVLRESRVGVTPAAVVQAIMAVRGDVLPAFVSGAVGEPGGAQRVVEELSGAVLLHLGAERSTHGALLDELERSVADAGTVVAESSAMAPPPSLGLAYAQMAANAIVASTLAQVEGVAAARIDPRLLAQLGDSSAATFGDLLLSDADERLWWQRADLAVRAVSSRRREHRHAYAALSAAPSEASLAQAAALVRSGAAGATSVGGALRGAAVSQLQALLESVDALVQVWLARCEPATAELVRVRERLFDAAAATYDDETLFVAAWRQLEHVVSTHDAIVSGELRARCKQFGNAMQQFGAYDVVVWRRVGRPTLMPTEPLHRLHERLEALSGALLEFQVLHTRHTNLARQRLARVALLERSRHVRARSLSVQALIGHELLESARHADDADPDDAVRLSDEEADSRLALKLGHNRFLVESDVSLAALNGARDTLLHALVGVRWATAQRTTTPQSAAQLAQFLDALNSGCDRVQALLTTWRAALQAAVERRVAMRDRKKEHAETAVLLVPARFVSHSASCCSSLRTMPARFASATSRAPWPAPLARSALTASGAASRRRCWRCAATIWPRG